MHAAFVTKDDAGGRVTGQYAIVRDLSLSTFSRIAHVVDPATNLHLAVKYNAQAVATAEPSVDMLATEREALRRLAGHPHVVGLADRRATIMGIGSECREHHALLMELACHGDLLSYVQTRPFSEPLARTYFRQLLAALEHAHNAGIYHRDVKLENLLLSTDFQLKVADFGLCHMLDTTCGGTAAATATVRGHSVEDEPYITGVCGSPGYVAPEVYGRERYKGSAADVWSAGCVLFAMLAGHAAFEMSADPQSGGGGAGHRDEWLGMILRGDYAQFWRRHFLGGAHLSPAAVDLLTRMFSAEPARRPTIADILTHPWVTTGPVLGADALWSEMLTRRRELDACGEVPSEGAPRSMDRDASDDASSEVSLAWSEEGLGALDRAGLAAGSPSDLCGSDDQMDPLCSLAEALEVFVDASDMALTGGDDDAAAAAARGGNSSGSGSGGESPPRPPPPSPRGPAHAAALVTPKAPAHPRVFTSMAVAVAAHPHLVTPRDEGTRPSPPLSTDDCWATHRTTSTSSTGSSTSSSGSVAHGHGPGPGPGPSGASGRPAGPAQGLSPLFAEAPWPPSQASAAHPPPAPWGVAKPVAVRATHSAPSAASAGLRALSLLLPHPSATSPDASRRGPRSPRTVTGAAQFSNKSQDSFVDHAEAEAAAAAAERAEGKAGRGAHAEDQGQGQEQEQGGEDTESSEVDDDVPSAPYVCCTPPTRRNKRSCADLSCSCPLAKRPVPSGSH